MTTLELIKTKNVLVRTIELEKDTSTEWHYHTETTDYFVCLRGAIQVEAKYPDEKVSLLAGERAEIKPMRIHRVVNLLDDVSEYLLIQGVGVYDFCIE